MTVNKAVTLRSVNGPLSTVIDGGAAFRCVYLTTGASLAGFTLTNGAARGGSGGGVYCESTNAVVSNCVITDNSAETSDGGGAYGGLLHNCRLTRNVAASGGGAAWSVLTDCTLAHNTAGNGGGVFRGTLHNCLLSGNSGGGASESTLSNCTLAGNSVLGGAASSILNNCALTGNSADVSGGGASDSTLNNCTLTGNSADVSGGGASGSTLTNCIVYFNTARRSGENYSESAFDHCCTTPDPGGTGNITADPQLASASHLSVFSPCRGAGSAAHVTGTDIDGEVWRTPPSIGCDEYREGAASGPLSVNIVANYTNVAVGFPVGLTGLIEGRTTLSIWEFGDGTLSLNQPYETHAWATPGDYAVTLWGFNDSHPDGVSVVLTIHVVQGLHYVAAGSTNPVAPVHLVGDSSHEHPGCC